MLAGSEIYKLAKLMQTSGKIRSFATHRRVLFHSDASAASAGVAAVPECNAWRHVPRRGGEAKRIFAPETRRPAPPGCRGGLVTLLASLRKPGMPKLRLPCASLSWNHHLLLQRNHSTMSSRMQHPLRSIDDGDPPAVPHATPALRRQTSTAPANEIRVTRAPGSSSPTPSHIAGLESARWSPVRHAVNTALSVFGQWLAAMHRVHQRFSSTIHRLVHPVPDSTTAVLQSSDGHVSFVSI